MISLEKLKELVAGALGQNHLTRIDFRIKVNGQLNCSPRDRIAMITRLQSRLEEFPDTEVVVTEFGNRLSLYVVINATCYDITAFNWR